MIVLEKNTHRNHNCYFSEEISSPCTLKPFSWIPTALSTSQYDIYMHNTMIKNAGSDSVPLTRTCELHPTLNETLERNQFYGVKLL